MNPICKGVAGGADDRGGKKWNESGWPTRRVCVWGLMHGPQHFRRARASSNRWIETGSTLLAHSAVLRWEGQFKDPTRETRPWGTLLS